MRPVFPALDEHTEGTNILFRLDFIKISRFDSLAHRGCSSKANGMRGTGAQREF